jgi:F-type H+-transporting ATPase subunit alpha
VPVAHQVMIFYAATHGYLKGIPVEEVHKFELGFFDFMETHHPDVVKGILQTGDLKEDSEAVLKEAIEEYKRIREHDGLANV